jgi:AcrR family transcriptional regulator
VATDRSGSPAAERETVRRDQLARLTGALIEVVAAKGSHGLTVAEVTRAAGVSRKTFYEMFENKHDCLLRTADLVIETSMREVRLAYGSTDAWPERITAALQRLFELAADNPGAVRLSLLEVGAAGRAGLERRERWFGEFEQFITDAAARAPEPGTIAAPVVKGIVGGLGGVLCRRLVPGAGRVRLEQLIPDLVSWIVSYHPSPAALLKETARGRRGRAGKQVLAGGRAPGSLAPHQRMVSRRGLPRGDRGVSGSFIAHNQRERILDAVASLTAAKGYGAVTVDEIAEAAAISPNTFYELFVDKEDAFLVAFEVGHTKCLAAVEAAYLEEPDWGSSVASGIRALLSFLAGEPAFAWISLVEVLSASPRATARSNAGVSTFSQMLRPGLERASGPLRASEVTVDAIAGGIFELCLEHAVEGRLAELPTLAPVVTYFALAPFIGSEQATSVALATR